MLAIVGGLGAALVFATVTLCNSRSSRMIGPSQLLAWVMLIGLAIVAPLVVLEGVPDDLDTESGAWLAVAGLDRKSGGQGKRVRVRGPRGRITTRETK